MNIEPWRALPLPTRSSPFYTLKSIAFDKDAADTKVSGGGVVLPPVGQNRQNGNDLGGDIVPPKVVPRASPRQLRRREAALDECTKVQEQLKEVLQRLTSESQAQAAIHNKKRELAGSTVKCNKSMKEEVEHIKAQQHQLKKLRTQLRELMQPVCAPSTDSPVAAATTPLATTAPAAAAVPAEDGEDGLGSVDLDSSRGADNVQVDIGVEVDPLRSTASGPQSLPPAAALPPPVKDLVDKLATASDTELVAFLGGLNEEAFGKLAVEFSTLQGQTPALAAGSICTSGENGPDGVDVDPSSRATASEDQSLPPAAAPPLPMRDLADKLAAALDTEIVAFLRGLSKQAFSKLEVELSSCAEEGTTTGAPAPVVEASMDEETHELPGAALEPVPDNTKEDAPAPTAEDTPDNAVGE